MPSNRMKLDYNNLIREIIETLTVTESEDAETVFERIRNDAWGISIGLELLTNYLKDIATLAIKRNDTELLELCKGLLIVVESEGGE